MWFLTYFFLHLIVYLLIRAEFLIWNWASLRSLTASEMLWAFLNGIRFDLSAMALTVGLCFLGLVWMTGRRQIQKTWILFFIFLNSIFYLINIVDIELFNFTARRFSSSSFFLVNEGGVLNLITPYLALALPSFSILFLYIFIAHRLIGKFDYKFSLKKKFIYAFLILSVSVLFARGGLQLKPLSFVDAKIFDNTYANNLVLNSSFTLIKSATQESLKRLHFFENKELLSYLNAQDVKPLPISAEGKKPNIVIVILEGFSKEYLALKNPEATPYFNQLRKEAVDFKSAYANGRRSIEGMAAILSGIPALMEEPFINSQFSANQIIGLGTLLKADNYHTSFFHGANKGSMHFDTFTKSVGIENHLSINEYPNKTDYDGTWGVFDEPFLQWTCQKLNKFPEPFLSTIFTLSSHQPYTVPAEYKDKFKDDRLSILKSVQYADYSLAQFMKCAEKQAWYQNTLFIFTADHTGPAINTNASFENYYQIPLVMFSPQTKLLKDLKSIDANQYAQHIDILPTILDILKIEYKNKNYLSRSLLRPGLKIIALYADRHYELVGDVKDQDKQLKAVQQYFSEGLYDNRLYYPVK